MRRCDRRVCGWDIKKEGFKTHRSATAGSRSDEHSGAWGNSEPPVPGLRLVYALRVLCGGGVVRDSKRLGKSPQIQSQKKRSSPFEGNLNRERTGERGPSSLVHERGFEFENNEKLSLGCGGGGNGFRSPARPATHRNQQHWVTTPVQPQR